MSATPLSKITSDCKSSNRRPLEKKSEKSKESLFGIDDMLNRPKTCPIACVPLSSSLIWPFLIVKLRSPVAFENEKSSNEPSHSAFSLASQFPPLSTPGYPSPVRA